MLGKAASPCKGKQTAEGRNRNPGEASLAPGASEFEVRLALPHAVRAGATRVRLLFNYGVLADRVDLCVDESASHVDPGPNGQQLVSEGHATSALLTLGDGAAGPGRRHREPPPPATAADAAFASRSLVTLPMGGTDGDEIVGSSPISRELEESCMHDAGATAGAGAATGGAR